MVPARAQGGADACATIEAKKTGAVHGRTAPPDRPPRHGLTGTGEDRTMTGRGGARPTTTPKGRESAAPLPPNATNHATRRPRFDGMERMFGKAVDSPSDAAGLPVRRGRILRQLRRNWRHITRRSTNRGRSGPCGRTGARSSEPDPRHPCPPSCLRKAWLTSATSMELCLEPYSARFTSARWCETSSTDSPAKRHRFRAHDHFPVRDSGLRLGRGTGSLYKVPANLVFDTGLAAGVALRWSRSVIVYG